MEEEIKMRSAKSVDGMRTKEKRSYRGAKNE